MEKILVSACLVGVNCKYNGKNNFSKAIVDKQNELWVIPVCPEQLGGLTTPRLAAEIVNGEGFDVLEGRANVVRKDGIIVTESFLTGAYETLKIAECIGVTKAILKARSPSCGQGEIYDGSFSNNRCSGDGVTTALLKLNGIRVWDENSFIDSL